MRLLLLLCLLFLASCGPVPPQEEAVPASAAQPVTPAYLPAAPGAVLDLDFCRITVGTPGAADALRQGYAVLRPAGDGQTFWQLPLQVENTSAQPIPTENFLVRVTLEGRSYGGSAHCFSSDVLPPGEACRVTLFAAVEKDRLQKSDLRQLRFLFHPNFAPQNATPMPYRYVTE